MVDPGFLVTGSCTSIKKNEPLIIQKVEKPQICTSKQKLIEFGSWSPIRSQDVQNCKKRPKSAENTPEKKVENNCENSDKNTNENTYQEAKSDKVVSPQKLEADDQTKSSMSSNRGSLVIQKKNNLR